MAQFATGVSVVGTVDDGIRYGMTVNSLASLSLEPLLLMFGCERDASLHAPLMAVGVWSVSVLTAQQRPVAEWFAKRGRPGVDQYDGQHARAGDVTGAPIIDGALAWFECRTWRTYEGGDHTIVVGEVLDLGCRDGDAAGLTYFRGGYGSTAGD
jgi:flavin reductase (DIM6/NTAB) family NADH-FMN oxidoreductase RutF